MDHLFLRLFSIKLFLFILTTGSISWANSSDYKAEALEKELYNQKPWLRLLYYVNGKSEVANPKFFLDPKGRRHPKQELLTSIEKMWSSKAVNDKHPICVFPARYTLIKRMLNIKEANRLSLCPKVNDFIKRSQPKSVSVVFSSYYLHNPSSAFGHTLLKINRKGKNSEDLLGYGINFAATVSTENALVYAIKGLFGFFLGEFKAIPYYYKVREYNNYESRDLWSYELDLTEEELELIILHAWELGDAWSYYLYLTKNCSYWILRVIEAAAPRLDLTKNLPPLYVIPIDTVKALFKVPGLVTDISMRPSVRRMLLKHFNTLNKAEKAQLKELAQALGERQTAKEPLPANAEKMLKESDADFLDAAILYYDYLYAKGLTYDEKRQLDLKRPLMIARSKKARGLKEVKEQRPPLPPEDFHPSSQFKFYGGFREDQSVIGFGLRPAMQDLIDPSWGFDPYSEINFFDLSAQIIEKTNGEMQLELGHFDLVRVGVLTPLNDLESKMAWRLRTGIQDLLWEDCFPCKAGYAALSTGVSVAFGSEKLSFSYFMIRNQIEYSEDIPDKHFRFGIGPNVGMILAWSDAIKSQIEGVYLFNNRFQSQWTDDWSISHEHQYYFKKENIAISLQGLHRDRVQQGLINLKRYF